jgi:Family of unknown function (DUF6308)
LVEAPETLYAKTADGVHVAYQAWGDGPFDLVVLRDPSCPVDVMWEEPSLSRHGIQWVTAGKLLARKRPRLIPVYDDVVRLALGAPGSYWTSLWEAFRDGDRLRIPLEEIRSAADVEWMSLLRVLDVVIWMRNRGKKDARDNELRNLAPILPE